MNAFKRIVCFFDRRRISMAVDDVFVFALFSSAVVVVVVVRSGGRSTTTTFTTSLALIPGATSWPFWNDFFRQFFVYLEERERNPPTRIGIDPASQWKIDRFLKWKRNQNKTENEEWERRHSNPIYVWKSQWIRKILKTREIEIEREPDLKILRFLLFDPRMIKKCSSTDLDDEKGRTTTTNQDAESEHGQRRQ